MPRIEVRITPEGGIVRSWFRAPDLYEAEGDRAVPVEALVDTGAAMSFISPRVVSAIDPPHLSAEPVARAGGVVSYHPTYLVRLRLGDSGPWSEIEVVAIEPASPGVDAIIGRDLLSRMILHWDGPAGEAWIET